MPHNNRMSASTALRTNDMWSKTIGHDPYGGGEQKAAASNTNAEVLSYVIIAYLNICSVLFSRIS